ncbi:MAG: alpha/beta hydrolase [Leadbetterella sp.]
MKTPVKYKLARILILFLLIAFKTQSQKTESYKSPPSEVLTIHSKILNEDRKVYVHLPKLDSSDLNKRFPVLYLMDAENHFEMLSTYLDYLSRKDVNITPKILLVSITNTSRNRDLTPTKITIFKNKPDTAGIFKHSGGNENFLQFIRSELIPMIDSTYKTQSYRIFGGHSLGGITSINCILTHPDMFDAYIAISPSFWWDDEYILKLTEKNLIPSSTLNKKLFYCNGNEGGMKATFHENSLKFDTIIKAKKLVGFESMYIDYPNETHMSVPIFGYVEALRFIFKK